MRKITNRDKINNSPQGLRTYLPEEAGEINSLRERINETFVSWGYKPIITPTMEYNEIFNICMGERERQNVYKLVNREGKIMALRPENTSSVARTVANRSKEINLPARFSYFAPVFRYDPHRERNREITQMGIELVGENDPGEVEVIIIAIEAIKNTGLKNFKLDIGHIGYVDAVLDNYNLSQEDCNKAKSYLAKRNLAGFKRFLENLENGEDIGQLLLMRGGRECLEEAEELLNSKRALKALEDLKFIYDFLKDYGVEDYINLDLSLIRNLRYYTGIVFEVFTEKLGYFICGGGRYDNLIGQYHDKEIPAAGFALNVDRIRKIAADINGNLSPEIMVIFNSARRKKALSIIKRLHNEGKRVIMKVVDSSFSESDMIKDCKTKQFNKIIAVFDDELAEDRVKIIDLKKDMTKYIDSELKGWI